MISKEKKGHQTPVSLHKFIEIPCTAVGFKGADSAQSLHPLQTSLQAQREPTTLLSRSHPTHGKPLQALQVPPLHVHQGPEHASAAPGNGFSFGGGAGRQWVLQGLSLPPRAHHQR